jgi:signal transduction histidine kinase
VGVGLALVVLVAAFNVVLSRELGRAATDRARSRATTEMAALRTEGGRLRLGESPDAGMVDAPIWVYADGRTLEAPRVDPGVSAAAARLASGPARAVDVPGAQTRLYAVPVVVGGRRMGTVVAGVSLTPYAETRHAALIGSLALAALLFALVAVAAWWLIGRALRPVAEMTAAATAWSEHDLDLRFALGEPFDELTELGATLDRLLDRIAAALRREQRLTAEISHELRTPLARIQGEADVALRRERDTEAYRRALAGVRRNADQLAQTIDALLAATRSTEAAAGTADPATVVADAVAACEPLARSRRLDVSVHSELRRPVRVGVDHAVVVRILQPVIENACCYGRAVVMITIAAAGRDVAYTIADDGPGVASEERDSIFEPGARGSSANGSPAGVGLGLALSRRLARTVSGDVTAQPGPGGRFVVRLPAG